MNDTTTRQPMTEGQWREALTSDMGDDGTYPFAEDDNCNITGYGHQDPATFAEHVNRFDITVGGVDPDDATFDAGDVVHRWVESIVDEHGQDWCRAVPEGTPGAFPVTTLWGHR